MPAEPTEPGYHERENIMQKPACLHAEHFFTLLPTTRQLSSLHFLNLIPRRQAFLTLGGAFSKCYIYVLLFILTPIPKDIFLSGQVSSMNCSKSKDWKN